MRWMPAAFGLLLMADMALMTVRGTDRAPTLAEAAAQLGVTVDDMDASFGVIAIDPAKGLYSVQVRADRLQTQESTQPYRGPFSNPRIEPFGPPEK
jgi:hypothetical protein